MNQTNHLDPTRFNRLSLGLIEKHGFSPHDALTRLESLSLNLDAGMEIARSLALQAALLTAVNTAKRAFLGEVCVRIPANTPLLLPWRGQCLFTLNEAVTETGGRVVEYFDNAGFTLTFGKPGSIDHNQARVVCNNWQAGFLVEGEQDPLSRGSDLPTAGIFAGAFAVFLAFLRSSGIDMTACDHSEGISLWRPDLDWRSSEACGPQLSLLPLKYWLLGLGHLGQAYLWNIALLPYPLPAEIRFLLQDDDLLEPANWSAGLLTEKGDSHLHKTRHCARWLEERGFSTQIIERRFDQHTIRTEEEPRLALCGFDNAASRALLEDAGFDLALEAGLGNDLSTFDLISFHSFPDATKTARTIWSDDGLAESMVNQRVLEALKQVDEDACGIIPLTIAGKSISASFVGACAAALVVAESLRALHGGLHYDKVSLHLRNLSGKIAVIHKGGAYSSELARNGFVATVPYSSGPKIP
jgi:hypothetical protein